MCCKQAREKNREQGKQNSSWLRAKVPLIGGCSGLVLEILLLPEGEWEILW
jgi:hypothetical protein